MHLTLSEINTLQARVSSYLYKNYRFLYNMLDSAQKEGSVVKLGEIIREYRLRNKMSMGDFAKASGISKPYISMLEANKNSNGGKPTVPSVETLQKVAGTLGILSDELLRELGDEEIDLRPSSYSEDEIKILNGYRALSDEGNRLVKGMTGQLNFSHAQNAMAI